MAVLLTSAPLLAQAADPQIASLVDADPVPAGGRYTYTVRIDNNAADAATNTRLNFRVPSGATFVSATPAAASCVASTGLDEVDCNLGTLGANGADSRTLVLTFRALGPAPASIGATATLTADNDTNPGNNTQTETTTVVSGANLALTKSASPNPVVGGGAITYTLGASNAGPNDSGNLVVTDNLPPAVNFVSASGAGWSCSHAAGVVTCTRAGPHAPGAAIPPITITGTVTAAGGTITTAATIAPAAVGGTTDPETADNTATVDTTVLPGADVRIASKSVTSAQPATAGANVSFLIQPRNAGPATATGVTVTDNLPAGWTFVSAAGTGWTCAAAGQTVTCNRASLTVAATDNITVVATAPPNAAIAPTGTAFTNTASITATSTDPVAGNNSASVNVTVLPDGADLRLTKTKAPDPVAQGATLTSNIVVANNGPRVATGPLRVVEVLSGETYASASGSGWVCTPSGNVVVCNHPNASGLAVGSSLPTLTILTTATSAGSVSNTACTGSSLPAGAGAATASPPVEGDPNPGNDCDTRTANATTVQPDLAIAKTATTTNGDAVVDTNETSVTYNLLVTNVSAAPQSATGVVITDTVPAFLSGRTTFGSITATAAGSTATFNCGTAGALVTCTQSGGQLNQGQSVSVSITVNRPLADTGGGTVRNTATVGNTAEGDPNAANNSAFADVTITPVADVEMFGKTVTPSDVRAGENATYVLTFRNNGPSTATNVVVSDTFNIPGGDAGLLVLSISSPKPGSSCNIAAGAVLTGAASYSCVIGSMTNGEVRTITVVTRPLFQPGNAGRSFSNTATITTASVENPAGGDNGNNGRSAVLTVRPALLDLLVNTTDLVDPVPYFAGNTFLDYRVRVTNNGPSYGTQVRIAEVMTPPAGQRVRFVCDTATAGGACNAVSLCSATGQVSAPGTPLASFSCLVPAGSGSAVGELAATQTKDIFLRFEALDSPAPTGDVFTSVATVSANEPEDGSASSLANNTATEPTTTRQRVSLTVTKAASQPVVSLNQPFSWTITVANGGPGNALQTDLTDTVPAGMTVTGAVNWSSTSPVASGVCALTAGTISCALGQLNASGVATITVPARITAYPAGGSLSNTATVDTSPAKLGGIDTPGGANSGTASVTVLRSSISGTVFDDRDRSAGNAGVPQAGEPRIAGVSLQLTGTDAFGTAISRTATTDASGNYSFADLPPSDATGYTVTESQPAAYINSPAAVPTSGGNAPSSGGSYASGGTGLPAGNSSFSGVVLATNTAATQYNFPELRRPSLSGFVYVDVNLDGVRNAGSDTAIAGATVRLLDAATGAVVATTVTNASGAYSFSGLDPLLAYTLEQPLPTTPGLGNGPVNPGLINGVACASGCLAQPNAPSAGTDRIASIDLSGGTDGTAFNFGEQRVTTVSGLVYLDADRDGSFGAADVTRLSGLTVWLVQGADCATGATVQTVTTAADGSYSFSNVLAGQDYRVCLTPPGGYGQSTPITVALTNLAVSGSAGNNFGVTLARLAGSVYADFSPATPALTDNGVRDAGETGIAGVVVTLSGRDSLGNTVLRTATTDADGRYAFDNLLQSDGSGYGLTEGPVPAGSGSFNDGRDAIGTAGGTAGNDVLSAIVLAAGSVASRYDFGELPIAPISGTVYIDRNRNGGLDASPVDGRISGVTLRLFAGTTCTGTPVATTLTDASGNYSFSGSSAGLTYTVCETQPAGYGEGSITAGAAGVAGTNAITFTNLPASGSAGNHFGERVGSLAGNVYLDANNDGLRQGGETGLPAVTVLLSGQDVNGQAVNRSTVTDAAGSYSFADLLAGSYTVSQTAIQPVVGGTPTLNGVTRAGTGGGTASTVATVPSAVSAIALTAAADLTAYDFAEILPVSLAGTVFIDVNNDGLQNPPADTGLAGINLLLTGTDDTGAAVSRSVTTAADGSYRVADLRPGSYTLTQPVQPAGTSNGITTAGTAGGSATPVGTTPSSIAAINLATPGTASTGNNFAEVPNNSAISGRVWLDQDNNGLIDAAETGLAGVVIELTGTDTAGRPVTRSTVTDASGNYSFGALSPGVYTLVQPQQPAATVNGQTLAGPVGGTATAVTATPSRISGITLGLGITAGSNNFAEVPAAGLAGQVWADNNNDGRRDPGESGLPGVTVQLTGTDDLGNAVSLTTTTAADGSYRFTDLRPGSYRLTEPTQPADTVNGQTRAGSLGGAATPVATLPSAITGITVGPGALGTGYDFGEQANSADLRVSKQHSLATFTAGHAASYVIRVRNVGELPTRGSYTLTDRLPAGLTLAAAPVGNGWACNGAVGDSRFSCTRSSELAAGAVSPDTVTVSVNVAASAAPLVSNAVMVDGGGEIDARRPSSAERDAFDGDVSALPVCTAATDANVCRDPAPVQQAAALSGTVWLDTGTRSQLLDGGDRRLAGWVVEVVDVATGGVVATAVTAADGSYRITGLVPGVPLLVRFRDPVSQVVFGTPVNGETAPGSSGASCVGSAGAQSRLAGASSCVGGNGAAGAAGTLPQLSVVLAPGQELPQQSLPVDPGGVVYDAGLRTPVPGAVVSLSPIGSCTGWAPATGIVGATLGGYVITGDTVAMTVGSEGLYQFVLAPAAPASCRFRLTVLPPAGYTPSAAIPPQAGALSPAGGPGTRYAVQPQAAPPTGAAGTATAYFLELVTGSASPRIVHNHIPLDPLLPASLSLFKTGDRGMVEVGDTLRYSITVQAGPGPLPRQSTVVDRLPTGFTYVRGTATVNDQPVADPVSNPPGGLGPQLAFNLGAMPATRQVVLRYRVRVGVGAQQGDGINRARAHACSLPAGCVDASLAPLPGSVPSNEGQFRVKVSGGVFGTEACFAGKVFVDCNNNHVQDAEELGIPGVRLVLEDGTTFISDSEGKYSHCGATPNSHVLKADPLTLPQGARLTTSSNRNLGDGASLWLDLKNGELARADFIEGSCSNRVLEQVKARRSQGEVRAPEREKTKGPPLKFQSKPASAPRQATDGADQPLPALPRATPQPANPVPTSGGAHGQP